MKISEIFKKKESKESLKNKKLLAIERKNHHNDLLLLQKNNKDEFSKLHPTSFVSLHHINKIYDNHIQAVYDFNLDINEHDFIVLVGPSGCGKSTTLRMIAGLEDITYGALYINGEYSNDVLCKDRKIGMVFQAYGLYPHLTVYGNLAFSLQVNHVNKQEIDERVKKVAEVLQLTDYLDRKPSALSGGQMQRVALGRAIIRDTKLFLMDEPLSNLDAKLRISMRNEIVKLHNELGTTTVYVTHDQSEAMTMATRIVVMNKGKIQQIGTPAEIYKNPANTFVANFIGSPAMNLIDATVESKSIFFDNNKFELKQNLSKKIDEFYDLEIENCNKDIENVKNKVLERYKKDKKFIEFKLENEDKLLKFVETDPNNPYYQDLQNILVSKDFDESNINTYFNFIKEKLTKDGQNLEVKELNEHLNNLTIAKENPIKNIYLGLRPENIKVSNSGFKYIIKNAELLGSEYYLHIDVDNKDFIIKVPAEKQYLTGQEIFITFKESDIYIYDSITTKKI